MKQLNWHIVFGNTHIIPDGRTVTPTDDIQTLLHCANIWDKDYTTLAEVLADDDTLFLICISDNAIDYLVRSTTFAGVALVPAMTSATTPSGVVNASSNLSTYYPYLAFDKVGTTQWIPNINSGTTGSGYIDYGFPSSVIITSYLIEGSGSCNFTCKLQGSNDGNTWTDLTSLLSVTSSSYSHTVYFSNSTSYSKYRLVVNKTATGEWLRINTLQFYSTSIVASESAMQYIGASDYASETLLSDSTWAEAIIGSAYVDYVANVQNPNMTSNTAPSGQCIGNSTYSGYEWYKAFDGNDATYGIAASSATTGSGHYLGYLFPNNVNISCVHVHLDGTNTTYKLQDSTDGETWNDASDNVVTEDNHTFFLSGSYKGVRAYKVSSSTTRSFAMFEMDIYGRENAGVQSWLKAGGITNKKYTTVSEVLSDLTTLATLMSSTDAIDYLVTAKGWATEICSDSNAMADIGMNNYAANTLLADSVWCDAIGNSTYYTSVLNLSVPTMTDNTHPYGECFGTHIISNPNYDYYKAFDKDTDTKAPMGGNTSSQIDEIGYDFGKTVKLCKVLYRGNTDSPYLPPASFILQTSADNITYEDRVNESCTADTQEHSIVLAGAIDCRYSKLKCTERYYSNNGRYYAQFSEVQFYGRKDI